MEKDLIKNRRIEVQKEIERLQPEIEKLDKQLMVMKSELDELDVTERVLDRLSSAPRSEPNKREDSKLRKPSQKKPHGLPTTRVMVLEALMDARGRGLVGLAPKGIRAFAVQHYDYNMGAAANTVPSRMWHVTNEITKDTETGLFSLPEK